MMKYILKHILFLCLLTSSANLVFAANDSLSVEVFKSVEQSRLKQIQQLLDEIGIAAPIKEEQLLKHSAYYSSYNPVHRQPNYVVHVIPKDILYGSFYRSNDFRPDPLLKENKSDSVDYWNSGYDRGHMAASADFKWNKKALSESYFYSNIAPQIPGLNQNAWSKLEMLIRAWAIEQNELIIVTGPVLNEHLLKIPQGSKQVSVPEYFFKIVLDYYPPTYKAIAFLYPNKNVDFELSKHIVSIDSIETLTGIDFFPALEDELENTVEAQQNIEDWDKDYLLKEKHNGFIPQNFGKGKLNTTQAKEQIGNDACICGRVVSTKYNENGKTNPTYINLDKKFPDQVFTVIVFGKDRENFTYVPEEFLKGKSICVKGKVSEYKGIPQIIANKEKQIEILKE